MNRHRRLLTHTATFPPACRHTHTRACAHGHTFAHMHTRAGRVSESFPSSLIMSVCSVKSWRLPPLSSPSVTWCLCGAFLLLHLLLLLTLCLSVHSHLYSTLFDHGQDYTSIPQHKHSCRLGDCLTCSIISTSFICIVGGSPVNDRIFKSHFFSSFGWSCDFNFNIKHVFKC